MLRSMFLAAPVLARGASWKCPVGSARCAVSEDAAASWSAAALCRFAIYAQKTVLTLLAPKPKRQRAGALQKLRHVVAPPRGRCADAPRSTALSHMSLPAGGLKGYEQEMARRYESNRASVVSAQ